MFASALLGALATVEVLAVTRTPGPGLDPDSASYLGAAESLVHGAGLRIPMGDWANPRPTAPLAHFPPGFPLAIAATVELGLSPNQGARVINAVANGITVASMTYLVGATVGILWGVITGVALLVARPLVLAHLSVLSEPLFLCFVALTIWGLAARWPPLVIGCLAALSAITRYAGVGVVGAVVLWQLYDGLALRARVRNALLSLIPAIVLLGAWVARTHSGGRAGPDAIRRFGLYGGFAGTLVQGAETLARWLVPTSDEPDNPQLWIWIAVVAAAIVIAIVVRGARRARLDETPGSRALAACATILVCYTGVLVVSRLVADPGIPFDERLLAPFILVATPAIVVATASAWPRRGGGLLLRGGALALFVAWVAASTSASLDEATWATTNGSDFAGEEWRTSPLLAWVRQHAPATPLYSNWPEAVFFYLHHAAWLLPPPMSDSQQWRAFADTLARRGALAAVFDTPSPDVAPPDSVAAAGHLRVIARLSDGTVYGAPISTAP